MDPKFYEGPGPFSAGFLAAPPMRTVPVWGRRLVNVEPMGVIENVNHEGVAD